MIWNVYSIRDQKSGRFMQSVNDVNDETAKRGFAQAVNTPSGIIGFAPKDFDLYKIGEFDDEKGKYTALECIELVVNGAQLLNVRSEDNVV